MKECKLLCHPSLTGLEKEINTWLKKGWDLVGPVQYRTETDTDWEGFFVTLIKEP